MRGHEGDFRALRRVQDGDFHVQVVKEVVGFGAVAGFLQGVRFAVDDGEHGFAGAHRAEIFVDRVFGDAGGGQRAQHRVA